MIFILITNIILVGVFSFLFLNRHWFPVAAPTLCFGFLSLLAVCNFSIWLIAGRKGNWRHRNYTGLEKRSFFRVVYHQPEARPRLQVAAADFAVSDISQSGLRFINDRKIFLARTIQGKITFSDGETVNITGKVEWKKNDEISLLLKEHIPHTTISKEQHRIADA